MEENWLIYIESKLRLTFYLFLCQLFNGIIGSKFHQKQISYNYLHQILWLMMIQSSVYQFPILICLSVVLFSEWNQK
jgi:hypothetical protein